MAQAFNRELFCNILKKACGHKSLTEYTVESGVNRTYISKYMNQRLSAPPSPDVLRRLANAAHNEVKYSDFMLAAGYLTKTDVLDALSALLSVNIRSSEQN